MNELQLKSMNEGHWQLVGEMTRNSLGNERLLNQLLQNVQTTLKLDLSEVSRVDTAGLAWLIHTLSELKKRDCRLELINKPDQLLNLMELGQVSNLFE
ncbi:STAS domain-containing protein [Pseudoalteromonas xiamenensis]|uniref:STAS domain-containing protein n=1 Tax=Pseudoalteromonas xiamenensis TaxID=882626 RepID=UPI0027E48D91|nr:STAS domain-containing protein [Pseudoalteromonas xiamenensis]WMN61270.1 STAS domain-containing protein [Pseudoalteromonas xiamenensis]